jgi:hypothetical protein
MEPAAAAGDAPDRSMIATEYPPRSCSTSMIPDVGLLFDPDKFQQIGVYLRSTLLPTPVCLFKPHLPNFLQNLCPSHKSTSLIF